jgi:MICOS complex subunit MIC26
MLSRVRVHTFSPNTLNDEHLDRVKSIISPDEQLTPGLLYVGVATLSGSILARNRFLLTRLLLPPLFLAVSANHFLPKTSENLTSYFASLEDTYFPTLAQKHDIANAHTRMTWERIKDSTQNGRAWLNRGAETTVHTIQEVTGLKLRETFGWAQGVGQKLEEKAHDTATVVEEKARETKTATDRALDRAKEKAEKKVEEIQRSV